MIFEPFFIIILSAFFILFSFSFLVLFFTYYYLIRNSIFCSLCYGTNYFKAYIISFIIDALLVTVQIKLSFLVSLFSVPLLYSILFSSFTVCICCPFFSLFSVFLFEAYDMAWYDMRYDIIWYSIIWYDMVWYGMVFCDMTWHDIMQYCVI